MLFAVRKRCGVRNSVGKGKNRFFLPRDAILARYMLWPCVCPSVSVTSRSCTLMAQHRNTIIAPHNSPGTLVFWSQRSPQNTLLLHTTNRKYHMAYRFMPFPVTLSDLEGHSPVARLFKCNSTTNICATFRHSNFDWHSALRGPSATAELLVGELQQAHVWQTATCILLLI